MDQPCQKAAPLIYWRSVVFPVFFSLLLFCVESHIVLTRMSITKPSFPGRAAQTYHSLLMQFWCQSEVVFGCTWRTSFGDRKISKVCLTLALANFTMRTRAFAMFSTDVGQAIYFPKKSICAPVGNLINLDMHWGQSFLRQSSINWSIIIVQKLWESCRNALVNWYQSSKTESFFRQTTSSYSNNKKMGEGMDQPTYCQRNWQWWGKR